MKSMNSSQSGTVDKAEAILNGAMQEFLQRGYTATSMDKVAKAAGVSKATVYSHFQDKEGLFVALVKRLAQQRFTEVLSEGNFPSHEIEPRIFLKQFLTRGLEKAIQDKEYHDFIRLIIGESGRFPELAQTFITYGGKLVVGVMTQYLKSHPELNIKDPEATARIVMGAMVHYVMVEELLHCKDILPLESDRLIDSLVNLLVGDGDN